VKAIRKQPIRYQLVNRGHFYAIKQRETPYRLLSHPSAIRPNDKFCLWWT